MSDREKFLNALERNEDDIPVRLAYADWLDDQGEHEEADRQRKWPAAKAWIIGFCEDHQPAGYDDSERLTYTYIVNVGLEAAANTDQNGETSIHCGSNMDLCYSRQWREFWMHWSIVTGIPLSQKFIESVGYSCAC